MNLRRGSVVGPGARRGLPYGTLALVALAALGPGRAVAGEPLFTDAFEAGLDGWEVSDPQAIAIHDSGDPEHGGVLELAPAGARLHALIRGSEAWGGYRIEGEMLFPTDEQNYLGLIYHYRDDGRRVDLSSIYVKGNGSYIRVNPRRDWNPARMLYEEYKTRLEGDDAIVVGRWQRFAAEVVGPVCHLYVGDLETPKVTFDLYEASSGRAGFKPRVVGGPVWLDNLRVTALETPSYRGPRRPLGIVYDTADAVRGWEVLGPLARTHAEVETAGGPNCVEDDGRSVCWRPFALDPRGAVLTARVTENLGSRTVAYFRAAVEVPAGRRARFEVSSLDNLVFWTDGVFDGYIELRDPYAWHDVGRNPEHEPTGGYAELDPGRHDLLLRVRGGQYATGGFFPRLALEPPAAESVACPAVDGVDALLARADVLLVGEIHGTVESPAFAAALACHAIRSGRSVTVGFELAEAEEQRFAGYLGSAGTAADREALLAGPVWRTAQQYGATSEAMVTLLESLRRWRRDGHGVSFALFNRAPSPQRDRRMAESLGALIERSPSDLLVVLTGNIHSRQAVGTPWDPEYEPMGYLLRAAHPDWRMISLDVAHAGGSAWLCTPEECGERKLGARGDAGEDGSFSLTVEDEIQADGHHGVYRVGAIHASPPAVR